MKRKRKNSQGLEIVIYWDSPKKRIIYIFFKNYKKILLYIGTFLLALLCTGISYAWYYRTKSYLPETPKNNVKKLPEEVKKQIELATPSATFRVPILLYHYVEYVQDKNDKERQSLDILPSIFAQQVQTLQNAGYTFITAGDLGDVLQGKRTLPEKPVILTFDDGHWDLDTDVLPILKKYDVKATAYIIPGFIGGSDFLSSAQLQDVARSGLIEIGAHTVHHLWLSGLPTATVQSEVVQSKTMLEQMVHVPIVSFAYPYGAFDNQAISIVKNAGFTTAVSTIPGIEVNQADTYFLYRIRPGFRIGQELLDYLSQNSFSAR